MDRKEKETGISSCLLAHEVLNKLSVIIGSCDIALEQIKTAEVPEPQLERRVTIVREMAWDLVNRVREHGCELDRATRTVLLAALCREQRATAPDARFVRAFDEKRDPLKAHR